MTTKRERLWVLWFGVVFMAITTIPYLTALANEGGAWKFTGFLIGVEDGNSYLAKMLSGAYGNWLFRTPYTTFSQNGILAFLPYILLGKLVSGNGIHAQLLALFHGFRFIAGILCILATYDFVANFLSRIWARKLGTLLAVAGGGFGFLFILGMGGLWQNRLPLEYYSPETFGFLSLFGLPHLALGRACLLWGISAVINGNHPFKKEYLVGLYFVVLVLVQPVTAALGYMLVFLALCGMVVMRFNESSCLKKAIFNVWHKAKKRLVWTVTPAIPLLLIILVSFQRDSFLQMWERQNIVTSPPPADYLLAYGWTIPFFVISIVLMTIKKIRWQPFLLTWVVFLPLLVYLPVNLQRRLAEGGWVALVILVVLVCEQITHGKKVLAWSVAIFSLSTVVILAGALMTALHPAVPVFRTSDEVKAFNFLSDNVDPGDVVLASYPVSNALPAWAPVRVVSGHGPESIEGARINVMVTDFFGGQLSPEQETEFLLDFQVKYVYWGPEEKSIGNWDPSIMKSLNPVFRGREIVIYEVAAQ